MKLLCSDIEILSHIFAPEGSVPYVENSKLNLVTDRAIDYKKLEAVDEKVSTPGMGLYWSKSKIHPWLKSAITFGTVPNGNGVHKAVVYYYFLNKDGSIRWITPKKDKSGSFLDFYFAGSFKVKAKVALTRLAFALGLGKRIAHGSFTVSYKETLPLHEWIKETTLDKCSIFTGTYGPNRKIILQKGGRAQERRFIKVPHGPDAEANCRHEQEVLSWVESLGLEKTRIPKVDTSSTKGVFSYENINLKGYGRSVTFDKAHGNAIIEYTSCTRQIEKYTIERAKQRVKQQLEGVSKYHPYSDSVDLALALEKLLPVLQSRQKCVALSHGDFTPWNMCVGQDLGLYDWELAAKDRVPYCDVVHFHFQQGVLIDKKNYKEIREDIIRVFQGSRFAERLDRYHLTPDLVIGLYLLDNVGYYLQVYQKQFGALHEQVDWLMNVWKEAVDYTLNAFTISSHRQTLIGDVKVYLMEKPYAAMKTAGANIDELVGSADIDILTEKKTAVDLVRYIDDRPFVQKVKEVKFSHMSSLHIYLKDGSFLEIDLLWDFRRKSQPYINPGRVLMSARVNDQGWFVPAPRHDLEYAVLFYGLNRSMVSQKHRDYFSACSETSSNLITYLNSRFGMTKASLDPYYSMSKEDLAHIEGQLKQQFTPSVGARLKSILTYWVDTFRRVRKEKGLLISLSGVDGAGKSTVITLLEQKLKFQHRRKVVVLRHRPSVLPILSTIKHGSKAKAEEHTMTRLPRTGKNSGMLSSYLRFSYYLLDYLIGQWYVNLKYTRRGITVIYDRYYFDFINDSRRSNIDVPRWFVKLWVPFITMPHLNILLYADAKIIRERKKELPVEEIQHLTEDYRTLFDSMSRGSKRVYKSLNNEDLDKTMGVIMNEYSKVA